RAGANVSPCETDTADGLEKATSGVELIIAAGAPGVQFFSAEQWKAFGSLKVAIDVNAVPPTGLGGVEITDKSVDRDGVVCYGAIGVGGLKMKIHKAAVARLFQTNNLVLDTEAIYRIGAEELAK
ncbi:MAG: bifunctional NADP-dependent methylenetetrahydromethanopterin dehydrogenase/methylenetetrahydrofolate dehydrogenase, partial [Planctomycetaceae bacterium]